MNIDHYKNHPREIISRVCQKYFKFLPDKLYLKLVFWGKMGYWLDLKHPKTFNEKLQWLKIYDRRPEYTTMVDKVAVKDYVASIIGSEYIIPTLGVWEKFDDIDFEKLPDKFVLKTSQGGGGGGVVICRDKSHFDKAAAKAKLEASLRGDWRASREWPYYNVPPRILAEKYISNGCDEDMTDYKFFCFDGEPYYCQVIRDRNSKETIDFYDMEWRHQEFFGLNPVARNGRTPVARPKNLATMQEICRRLSKDLPFVRVDLYEVNASSFFGELTFYPMSGFGEFTPDDWNARIADLLNLPTTNRGGYNIKIINNLININPVAPELNDYKFYCFNGEPKAMLRSSGRFSEGGVHFDYYDMDFNLLPFEQGGPNSGVPVEKPITFEAMKEVAAKLSAGIPHVRVDLYEINNKIYFGELTFFDSGGFAEFNPPKWDRIFGDWIELPKRGK